MNPRTQLASNPQNYRQPLTHLFNRAARSAFPSISKLTFNPLFKRLVDMVDIPANILVPVFRDLPPNHLRLRIGAGNDVLANQVFYLFAASTFWHFVFSTYSVGLDSTILDLGCGCGRYARHIQAINVAGEQFRGRYVGVDIDEEMIGWCLNHFDCRFRFHLSSDKSSSYGTKPPSRGDLFRIPEEDESFDFIFSASLFTHLLQDEIEHYLSETFRLLKPNSIAHHTIFLKDIIGLGFNNGRQTFAHRRGHAHLESERQPHAAVAYDGAYLISTARSIGFRTAEIVPGQIQSVLRLQN